MVSSKAPQAKNALEKNLKLGDVALAPLKLMGSSKAKIAIPRHEIKLEDPIQQFVVLRTKYKPKVKISGLKVKSKNKNEYEVSIQLKGPYELLPEKKYFKTKVHKKLKLKADSDLEFLDCSAPKGASYSTSPKQLKVVKSHYLNLNGKKITPFAVFAPDGRKSFNDTRYPWCCLCQINNSTGGSGSGFLVGPRHVATSSHVIDWVAKSASVSVLVTAPNKFLAKANVIYGYATVKYLNPASIDASDADEDYAVLVLDQKLGDQFGWLGIKTYDSAWDNVVSVWRSIGYPRGGGWNGTTPAFQKDFLLDELGSDVGSARTIYSSTIDSMPGQSGSPVFGFWEKGPYAVGVVQGGKLSASDGVPNIIAGGSLLKDLVVQAKKEYP